MSGPVFDNLRLPAIAAPMFLVSGPDLVVEISRSGIVGTFPALNPRTTPMLGDWIDEISERLAQEKNAAPYGINLVVHHSNSRLEADLELIVDRKVPFVITSLGAAADVVRAVHGYGGKVFHDVINLRHAQKAVEAGVDGIIAVCAGAGGHAGLMSPFALVPEIRKIFDGQIALSGAISTGAQIASARLLGADMAYLGTRFIATKEATASAGYKAMICETTAADIVYTPNISGVAANFLRPSIEAAGLDPENLPPRKEMDMSDERKAWKDLWSAGQGVGSIDDLPAAADLCERLRDEYRAAMGRASSDPFL